MNAGPVVSSFKAREVTPSREASACGRLIRLEDAVDLMGTSFELEARAAAARILSTAKPDRGYLPAFVQVMLRDLDPLSADGLLQRLDLLGREGRAAGVSSAPEADRLRGDLAAFAPTARHPRYVRLLDKRIPTEAAEADFRAAHANSLRLMRMAADQMFTRGDLRRGTFDAAGEANLSAAEEGVALLKLSMVAINQMVYEEMGGSFSIPSRLAEARSMEALTHGSDPAALAARIAANGGHLGLLTPPGEERARHFAALTRPAQSLDSAGRLRLRDAVYARLVGQTHPPSGLGAAAAPNGEAPAVDVAALAPPLAAAIARVALHYPAALNACLLRTVVDLGAEVDAGLL